MIFSVAGKKPAIENGTTNHSNIEDINGLEIFYHQPHSFTKLKTTGLINEKMLQITKTLCNI